MESNDIAGLGITNQRETAIMWNKSTGKLVYNAIVWQDTRTQDVIDRMEAAHGSDYFRKKTGLPLATYFAASKIVWILDNVEGARKAAEAGDLLFGTPDTWLLWNLTGGAKGVGSTTRHATDITNASRTMLMDLGRCSWDATLIDSLGVAAAN